MSALCGVHFGTKRLIITTHGLTMVTKKAMLAFAVLESVGLWCGIGVAGPLKLHGVFSSNMVLQREKPIAIWGWAEPGQAVAVRFGDEKAEATAAGDKGRWEVTFPARPANDTGQKLIVVCGDTTIELDNIVIGDVWVMNGQSNMGFGLSKVQEADMEMAAAHLPLLRCANIAPNESEKLEADIPADKFTGWIVSTPETAGDVSAIGHVFGSRLQQALQIPIGIIDTSRGGASIESLVPRQKFKDDPLAAAYLASVEKRQAEFDWDEAVKKLVDKWEKDVAEKRKKGVAENQLPVKPTRDDLRSWNIPGRSPSDAASCYNGMFGVFKGLNIKGVIFHQGYNNAIGESSRPRRYQVLMRLMVEGWREDFADPQLPVGVIEFCAGGISQTPDNFELLDRDPASYIREAQRLGLAAVKEQKNTAFIPGYDQQIPGLHPVKKQIHGIRAARWALGTIYGLKMNWDAASLLSAQPSGDVMVLTFDKPVMPDTLSTVPEGFEIAGEDAKFYRAHAAFELIKDAGVWNTAGKSHDAKRIYVWSPLVKTPVAVRYAWARSPMGNLKVNGKPWLPLQSFRTDKWDWPETDDPTTNALTGAQMKDMEKEAAARNTSRRTEEARQATDILRRLEMLGKTQSASQ